MVDSTARLGVGQGRKSRSPGTGEPARDAVDGPPGTARRIHGTPDAASIGYSASHGCIRMRVPEAEWLFEQVDVGTPVMIVA